MIFLKIALGWILYFAVHSLLASNRVKERCRSHFPALFPYYRIIYNLIALGGILLLAFWSLQDTALLFKQTAWMNVAGMCFIGLGVLMLGIAFASFNLKEFLGLKAETHGPEAKLVTKGVYRYVRHPLYSGILVLLPGLFLCRPTVSVVLFIFITIIYIEIGSRLEEKKLIGIFGQNYMEYSKKVKRYFPFVY